MKRKWLRALGWVGVLLSLGIVVGILWRSVGQLRELEWRQFLWPGLIGLGLYGVSLALQAFVWTGLVSRLSLSSFSWRDVQVYFATHLTRRLPGLPWYMAGRALSYERGTGRPTAAMLASLVEWGGMLLAAGLWAIVGHLRGMMLALAIAGMAVLLLAAYLGKSRLLWTERLEVVARVPAGWAVLAGVSYTLAWLLGGLILYCLIPLRASLISVIDVTSTWALSGGASMLMVFVPAGLGVRELTLSLLLRPHMGDALALVVALLMRVLFIMGDLMWGGLYWLVARLQTCRR